MSVFDTMEVEAPRNIFEIYTEEITTWERRMHKHNFFELVYVEKGSGSQCINTHEFTYEEGNIFLLPPLDCHSFKIAEPSQFLFIRFTSHFFSQEEGLTNYREWFDKVSYILANYNRVPGDIIATERERKFILESIRAIQHEYHQADRFSDAIIAGSLASILNVLARSIEQKYVDSANEVDARFGELLRYIHTHLTDKERLNVPNLAEKFGVSPSYFSEYFKKMSGKTLSQYILKSKIHVVETKILHTDQSLKEMAYDLNFTDSSHLARSFKQVYGMTVKEFRAIRGQVCRT